MLRSVRTMTREAVALSRNYRHAALLRRQLRARCGAVAPARPGILIGEALTAIDHAPWTRMAMFALLLVIAARR